MKILSNKEYKSILKRIRDLEDAAYISICRSDIKASYCFLSGQDTYDDEYPPHIYHRVTASDLLRMLVKKIGARIEHQKETKASVSLKDIDKPKQGAKK